MLLSPERTPPFSLTAFTVDFLAPSLRCFLVAPPGVCFLRFLLLYVVLSADTIADVGIAAVNILPRVVIVACPSCWLFITSHPGAPLALKSSRGNLVTVAAPPVSSQTVAGFGHPDRHHVRYSGRNPAQQDHRMGLGSGARRCNQMASFPDSGGLSLIPKTPMSNFLGSS